MNFVTKIPVKKGYFPFITGVKTINKSLHTIFVMLPYNTEGEPLDTYIIKGFLNSKPGRWNVEDLM